MARDLISLKSGEILTFERWNADSVCTSTYRANEKRALIGLKKLTTKREGKFIKVICPKDSCNG